jgi:hypothetical protein
MPLNKKGRKIMKSMKDTYGKDAKSVLKVLKKNLKVDQLKEG